MDTQRQDENRPEDYGDESLNTGSTSGGQQQQQGQEQRERGGIHNNALHAASMGRPATAQVNPHDNSGLANTGTNISYEGATAPGSGGSAGRGETSGQPDAGNTISTSSDYDQAAIGKHFDKAEGDDNITDDQIEGDEQR
jgi:hypothetical protein